MLEAAKSALEKLRPALQADGADLVMEDVNEGVVTVRLVIGPKTCRECLLSPDELQQVIEAALIEDVPSIQKVKLKAD